MTSTIKVNNIQNQCGANIIKENSNTITLGASGDTIALASGASQTGFGRTGTVDWQTGSIKTSTFTAANGEGYFANTAGGAFTMNLPAGSAGNIVSVVDYTNTFQTNNLTIAPNGSQKIGGTNASAILSTEGQSVTFVFVDATEGWKNTMDSTSNVTGRSFLTATGGTITTSGNFKIHTFTGPATFNVSAVSNVAAENTVSYMNIAAGGGGSEGGGGAGGGGAGGFREFRGPVSGCYAVSPLNGSTPITVTAQGYPITIGAGGTGAPGPGGSSGAAGANSVFSSITSAGGGGGRENATPNGNGGSGGGGSYQTGPGGTGNTPPVSPPQGNAGGTGALIGSGNTTGAGGGGATAAGQPGPAGTGGRAGAGGAGATTVISGSPVTRASGGNGHGEGPGNVPNPTATPGGGGASGAAGTANTGGGGGSNGPGGGNGGSGIVIIRYKFQ